MMNKFNVLVFVLYALLITFVSMRPMNGANIEPWDKLIHLIAYAVFAILGYRVANMPRHYLTLCIGITVYGGMIEIAQSFMPSRAMSAMDIVANILGVILGAIIAKRLFSSQNKI